MLKIFTIFFCPSNQFTVHPSHITVLLPYPSSHTIVLLSYPSSQTYPDSKATVLLSYHIGSYRIRAVSFKPCLFISRLSHPNTKTIYLCGQDIIVR